jgi:CheY-like chemotaxis protein
MNAALKSPSTDSSPDTPEQMKEKIMLIDDDPAIRQLLTRLLTEEGYTVLSASNGVEAIELVNNAQFDLVLLDLNMPVMDGWETFEKITSKNPLLPFVIITARPNQLFPAVASGTGALMEKPLDLPKLISTIRTLLKEPPKVQLARMTGQPAEFFYVPPRADKLESHAG